MHILSNIRIKKIYQVIDSNSFHRIGFTFSFGKTRVAGVRWTVFFMLKCREGRSNFEDDSIFFLNLYKMHLIHIKELFILADLVTDLM